MKIPNLRKYYMSVKGFLFKDAIFNEFPLCHTYCSPKLQSQISVFFIFNFLILSRFYELIKIIPKEVCLIHGNSGKKLQKYIISKNDLKKNTKNYILKNKLYLKNHIRKNYLIINDNFMKLGSRMSIY